MDPFVNRIPFRVGEVENCFAVYTRNNKARANQYRLFALQKYAKIIFNDNFSSVGEMFAKWAVVHFHLLENP